MAALIDNYSNQEFIQIVKNSKSIAQIAKKLGYISYSGASSNRIKKRIEELKISTEHFSLSAKVPRVERTEENVFCENSTANQSTLRRWYIDKKYTEYKCSICGMTPIWQGKELTLILDHINGNNHDNRLENLRWVCPNCNQQLETTGFKKIRTLNKEKKKYYCIDCGKEVTQEGCRCIACSHKAQYKVEHPDRETLKYLIRTKPFTQIGKDFGVSDNAIRKWCESYGLPKKTKEIKAYSDQEWDLI